MPNLGYNTKHLASHTSLLSDIKENTKNIHVDVGNVNVNTDTLETKIQATNDKLDSFSGHTNNTIAMGDGSTQLRTVGLGYDRTNGKVVSNLIDAAGHQQIDLVSGGDITSKLDSLAGAGNNNVGEGSSKLQIYNYGRDVSAGNFKPMVVNSSAEQIVALSATDNAVLDNISAHTGTVDGCVASNKMNVNISSTSGGGLATEAKQDDIETSLTSIETDIEATNTKLGTIETDIEATNTLLTTIDGVLDNAELHLGNIDTGVDVLEACVGSNKVNVNISSGNITGFATSALQGAGLPSALSSDNLKVSIQEGNITGFATSALQGAGLPSALSSNNLRVSIQEGNISGFATSALQGAGLPSALSSDNLKVSIQEGNITGFATASNQSTTNTKLGTIETDIEATNTKLGTIETDIEATNTLLTTIDGVLDNAELHLGNIETAVQLLDNAVDGNFLNVNLNLAGSDVANNSGNKSNTCPRVVIATDDVNISAIKATHDITTTTIHNNVSIAGSSTDTNSTVISFTHYPRSITILAGDFSGSQSIAGNQVTISPLVSYDNSTYFDLSTFVSSGIPVHMTSGDALTVKMVVIENARFPFMKIKLTNGTGSAQNFHSVVSF